MANDSASPQSTHCTFTRVQLYELVWKQPVRDVATAIGISDVALAKACRRLNVPVPGRGYWAKVAAGHSLSRIPLLPDPKGRSEVRFDMRPTPPPPVTLEHLAQASSPNEEVSSTPSTLSPEPIRLSDLSKPHMLTRSTRAELKRRTTDSRGLYFALPAIGWKVAVSQSTNERALVIVDTICLALKSVGATLQDGPKQRWQDEATKSMFLDDEPIHVAIREHVRKHRRTEKELAQRKAAGESYPRAHEMLPTGNLVLTIPNAPYGSVSEWRDSKSRTIEAQIPAILAALAALPTVFKNARHAKEEAERVYREEEQKRWKVEERNRRNKERMAELLSESRALDEQLSVLAYLDHLEKQIAQRGYAVTDKLMKGIARARELAGKLDPTEGRVALLQKYGLVTTSESGYFREEDQEDA